MRTAARVCAEVVGFAAILFLTRFVARPQLAVQLDEECHIGGIAVDVLAHGVRFPLSVYVQSDYDNGSLFSGILAAVSFSLLGRSFLALKLVTHMLAAIGAVAALSLLRRCLDELELTSRGVRWTAIAVLVIAIALAPRVVTLPAMCTVGIGAPLDGAMIDTLLLVAFARHPHRRSAAPTAALWMLVGLALYLNKATVAVMPALAMFELVFAWRSPTRLLAAASGLLVGVLPELWIITQRPNTGWAQISDKMARHSQSFPRAFFESAFTLAEYRIGLILAWVLALGGGTALLLRSRRRVGENGVTAPTFPSTLALVVLAMWVHVGVLLVMAQGGFDYYTIYGYPTLVVLLAVIVAWGTARAATRWGEGGGWTLSAAAVAMALVLYWPEGMAWGFSTVSALWRNRSGAACSFRLAEGFRREYESGLAPPGRSREQHVIDRCRSLAEPDQVLDCIGGIARDLHYTIGGKVNGEPPADLGPTERRAYAYYYGMRRNGDMTPCADFVSADLRADCTAAVQLDCLVRGGWGTRRSMEQGFGRCTVPQPPMQGYWAELRSFYQTKEPTRLPHAEEKFGQDDELAACKPVFEACY